MTLLRTWLDRLLALGSLALASLVLIVFAAWVFVAIADEVREGEYLPIEERIMLAFREGDPPHPIGPHWLVSTARDVTALGSVVVLTTTVILVAGFLAFTRRFAASLFVLAASTGGLVLNNVLKAIFGRERPDETLHLVEIDSLSFPSGHAMLSATIYLTLAVLLTRLADRRREKSYLLGAALLLSFAVGLSRVYLGVHYPTDVIAGWAAGIAWAQICWFVAHMIDRRRLAGVATEDTAPAASERL
jgi:undecaprenyl-diphosphatase